jgi:hypothetical protein
MFEISLQNLSRTDLTPEIVEVRLALLQVLNQFFNVISVCILSCNLLDFGLALRTRVFTVFCPSFNAFVAVKMGAAI